MMKVIKKAIELFKKHKNDSITIISHIDADGLSAAAILYKCLQREGVEANIVTIRQIDPETIEDLAPDDLTFFTDLGSGQTNLLKEKFKGHDTIILDHHQPERESWQELVHFNPYFFGIDGSSEISGAGSAYLFAKHLNGRNVDLSYLAIIGAIGDMQNFWGSFTGMNRIILEDAIKADKIEVKVDLALYGRYTRPIFKALELLTDPYIPGISGSEAGSINFLNKLGIRLQNDNEDNSWRRLADLSEEEKRKIADALIARAMAYAPKELAIYVPKLIIGEVYSLKDENDNSPLKDVEEFATCLNAAGRNRKEIIGIEVAIGRRGLYYKVLQRLLEKHRRNLAKACEIVIEEGIDYAPKGYLQFFDAESKIDAVLLGSVVGLVLGSDIVNHYKPLVGFVETEKGYKISARCSKLLAMKNMNLGKAIKIAASEVGGSGGGHAPAAGAFVPKDKINEFLEKFEKLLLEQMKC